MSTPVVSSPASSHGIASLQGCEPLSKLQDTAGQQVNPHSAIDLDPQPTLIATKIGRSNNTYICHTMPALFTPFCTVLYCIEIQSETRAHSRHTEAAEEGVRT